MNKTKVLKLFEQRANFEHFIAELERGKIISQEQTALVFMFGAFVSSLVQNTQLDISLEQREL